MDFSLGDLVLLKVPLPYLKTADPTPMLRPADLISSEELGEIVGLEDIDVAKVRFRRGIFLIPLDKLLKQNS